MRLTKLLYLCSAVFSAAFAGSTSSAQIVVLREGEKAVQREQRYGYCWLTVGEVNYVSGIIYLPQDDIRRVFQKAYEAFGRANLGSIRDTFCRDDFTYAGGADDDIKRWIENNPNTRFERNGWTGGFPTAGQASIARRPAKKSQPAVGNPRRAELSVAKGPTPNQLKYQREMEAFNQRIAEIEKIKADAAARHAANQAAAKQVIANHEQDVARNRAEVAAAQRRYQQELAEHQRLVALNETKTDRERKVEWKEAIVVCEKSPSDGQSKFGNWRCDGPLQMTYAKLDEKAPTGFADMGDPGPLALSQACGGNPESVRDLGIVGSARLFGCGYGLHPDSRNDATARDQAVRHGIGYVPGRATYHCPAYKSYCRTN